MKFYKYVSRLEKIKYPIYCGLQERRQLLCFLFTTFVELLYIPANILGLNDYHHSIVFDVYNWVQLIFVVLLQVAFWKNKVSTKIALHLFFIAIAAKLSAESLYELFYNGLNSNHIFGNFNIILVLSAVSIAVRLKRLAFIILLILTIDLVSLCFVGSPEYTIKVMRVFFVGYMLVLFITLFDSKDSARGLRQPSIITAEEKRAINMLIGLNEDNKEKVVSLLAKLSEEENEKIYKNTQDYFLKKQVEEYNFISICPELTKSEIEICKLIIRDKSLKEICAILGKSRSNITSQRTHIRRKLNLQKQEDLKTALIVRLNELDKK